jgi:hypothetical protein
MKRSPLERHDSSGVVLLEHFRQGDPSSSETSQHHPVILDDLLLLRLRRAVH